LALREVIRLVGSAHPDVEAKDVMLRLDVVVGIRSHFIKLAALQRYLRHHAPAEDASEFSFTYINTGQHYDYPLAGQFFDELDVEISVDLRAAEPDNHPREILLNSIRLLERRLEESDDGWPHAVVVFGDANATLAGALAAARLGLPVIHIEAGLRTGRLDTLEEINRRAVDHISSLHIASSEIDLRNLEREGLGETSVYCGDLVKDLVHYYAAGQLGRGAAAGSGDFVLATVHRAESLLPSVLPQILNGLGRVPRPVVLLAHPSLAACIREQDLAVPGNVVAPGPVGYRDLLATISACAYVVTDSGALQREAHFLGKRCLVLQERPFWSGLCLESANIAVNPEIDAIMSGLARIEDLVALPVTPTSDFGTVPTARAILNSISGWWRQRGMEAA